MTRNSFRLLAAWLGLSLWVGACGTGSPQKTAVQAPSGFPVVGDRVVVSSAFGAPRGRSTHRGIDLSAPKGSAVYATADGIVQFAGRSGEFGRLVVLDHGGGWITRYAHLKKIRVDERDKVRRGQVIGTVGKSGNATGYHLHYEVHRQGTAVDPAKTF